VKTPFKDFKTLQTTALPVDFSVTSDSLVELILWRPTVERSSCFYMVDQLAGCLGPQVEEEDQGASADSALWLFSPKGTRL